MLGGSNSASEQWCSVRSATAASRGGAVRLRHSSSSSSACGWRPERRTQRSSEALDQPTPCALAAEVGAASAAAPRACARCGVLGASPALGVVATRTSVVTKAAASKRASAPQRRSAACSRQAAASRAKRSWCACGASVARRVPAQAGAARSSDAPIRHWLTARRTGWRTSTSSRASGSHLGSHCAARRLPSVCARRRRAEVRCVPAQRALLPARRREEAGLLTQRRHEQRVLRELCEERGRATLHLAEDEDRGQASQPAVQAPAWCGVRCRALTTEMLRCTLRCVLFEQQPPARRVCCVRTDGLVQRVAGRRGSGCALCHFVPPAASARPGFPIAEGV
eukprot:scaffold7530_cov74-Phaeocystis_antarctica.AAC.2